MASAAPPTGFLQPGDPDVFDTDALAVEFGYIDGYRMVYERAPRNWAVYSLDVPGIVATGATRDQAEERMRAALPRHLAPAGERATIVPPRCPRSARCGDR